MDLDKIKKIHIFPVFLVFFVENFGFSLVFTLFGPLLLDPSYHLFEDVHSNDLKNFFIVLLFASFPMAQFFSSPFIGDVADHHGRKKAFIVTLIGAIIGFVLSAFSILIHNYSLLLISRIIAGFSASNMGICLASIADFSSSEKQRGRNYGFIVMTAGIAWVSASLIGGYLGDRSLNPHFNPAIPFLLSAIITIVTLFIVIRYYGETRIVKDRPIKFVFVQGLRNIYLASKTPEIRFLYFIYFLWIIGWGTTLQWFSFVSIERYSVAQEAIAFGIASFAIFWILGSSILNYLALRYWCSRKAVITSLFIVIFIFIGCSNFSNYNAYLLGISLVALFGGVITSNLLNIVSMHAPYHMQGKIMGLTQSVIALSWVLSPLVNGFVASINIDYIYSVAAVFTSLVVIFLLIQSKLEEKRNRKGY